MMTTSIPVMHSPGRNSFFGTLGRIIGVLAAVAALAACSSLKIAYRAVDEVAFWWLDAYVDFTDPQEARVREDLRRLYDWHRAEELPQVVALLQRVEAMVPGEVGAEQVCAIWPRVRERLRAVSDRAGPSIVAVALEIEPAQIAHMRRRYEKSNREYERDWLKPPPAELREKRVDSVVERAEMLYGRLSAAQRGIVEEHAAQSVFDARRANTERLRRQSDTLQVVQQIATQRPPAAEAQALVRALIARSLDSPDPAYRAQQEALVQENCRMLAALHNATTPAQRDHAVRRLRQWQRELRELSGAS
jgi:hypothetical protein